MPTSYGKGAFKKATVLHSKIIRSRGECERCGSTDHLQTAHIISRKRSNTRTDLRNAFCLCAKCHWYLDHWAVEMYLFILEKHGSLDLYYELKELAEEKAAMDWPEELERLQAIPEEEWPNC